MGYIYLITNKVNGKRYVGQTVCADIEARWCHHRRNDNTIGRYLKHAYTKHGIENFRFQVICVCFDEDADRFEAEYIKKFNTLVPNGYNLKEGGRTSKQHPETIRKMSESLKGRKMPPLTDAQRKQRSERIRGEKHPHFGKKMSEEQKRKIGETRKKLYSTYNIPEESKKRQLEGLEKGRKSQIKTFRKVNQYDLDGNMINTFPNIVQAGKQTNINYQTIGNVCRQHKKYKTAGGFIWKFAE